MSVAARTRPDQLAALVRDRILAGAEEAGRPIRQDALAAELGVSKIPLREALARLERDGLIRSEANRGYFVRGLDAAEAEEVYALRLKLEPDAVAAAAARASDTDRETAARLLVALDEATRARGEDVGELNRAFHLALVRPGAGLVTLDILERLHVLAERYVRKHLEPATRGARAEGEHRALLDAWTAGDGDEVARLTRAHIAGALDDLRTQLTTGA